MPYSKAQLKQRRLDRQFKEVNIAIKDAQRALNKAHARERKLFERALIVSEERELEKKGAAQNVNRMGSISDIRRKTNS